VTAARKLVGSLGVGQRTPAQPRARVKDARDRRRPGHLPAIFPEADEGEESALLAAFGRRYPAPNGPPGRARRPLLRWPHGLADGQGKKPEKGRGSARVEVRVRSGKARVKHGLAWLGSKQIKTSVVERHKGTSRLRNQRKVRKTLAFSTVPRYHRWMRWLSVGLENFCRGHGSLQRVQATQVQHRSPAMAARLTDHIWTVREWLLWPVLGRQG
jgi:hypothetical protein